MANAIEFDDEAIRNVEAIFKNVKNGAKKVIARAVNKTGAKAKTETSVEIRKVVNLKAKRVGEALKLKRATFRNLTAVLTISGKPIPLIEFGARKTKRNGVSIRVRKLKPIEKHRTSFIATRRSGSGEGVFIRKGPARLPIDEKIGPSIPAVFQFNNESTVSINAAENLVKNLDSEIKFLLSKQP